MPSSPRPSTPCWSMLEYASSGVGLLARHRKLVANRWDYSNRRRPGRPLTSAAVKALILRMAAQNPRWGHRRIHGKLTRLAHKIAASTVRNILNGPGSTPPRAAAGRHGSSS
ncbi:helix-turn-helix domain-containing protein [Nonomuraea angiospora]|uniref:helix-turn-helix domain-containing protein n=1 Tax=Nonomuraea angiospora TaxID=46172 RepID=UPI0038D39421